MKTEQTVIRSSEGRKPQIELQKRYGRIAISAVAAALNCGGKSCLGETPADDEDQAEPRTKTQKHN